MELINVTGDQGGLELVIYNIIQTILKKRKARSKIEIICRFTSFLENCRAGFRLTF